MVFVSPLEEVFRLNKHGNIIFCFFGFRGNIQAVKVLENNCFDKFQGALILPAERCCSQTPRAAPACCVAETFLLKEPVQSLKSPRESMFDMNPNVNPNMPVSHSALFSYSAQMSSQVLTYEVAQLWLK